MEASGIVDEVGKGVTTGLKVGDHVIALIDPHRELGAYREQIAINAQSVVLAPAGRNNFV